MIRTETEQTVTLRRPDAETGELVEVDVVVPAGEHTDVDEDTAAAVEQLWAAGLAVDPDRPQNPDAEPSEPSPEPRTRRGKPSDNAGEPGTTPEV